MESALIRSCGPDFPGDGNRNFSLAETGRLAKMEGKST
jgi:hypothetical protein